MRLLRADDGCRSTLYFLTTIVMVFVLELVLVLVLVLLLVDDLQQPPASVAFSNALRSTFCTFFSLFWN
ncbi:hypothetical protein [Paraburkholderia sp. LEh10]|uniref:hypothetical protein n=1 Tax=Paraburkholderia sp. LEh10 TaxID=2821353 RepID=UPI001AE5B10E|nr:hypothetical protein [Paraburkholderia sp. LEh10]